MDIQNNFDEARQQYKPTRIHLVFVAESPPSIDRFFYFEDVRKYDLLFIAMVKAIYDVDYGKHNRGVTRKTQLLNQFKRDGYFLLDAVEYVLPDKKKNTKYFHIEKNYPKLLNNLNKLEIREKNIPIILIAKPVHEILYPRLKENQFSILNNEPIPFPIKKYGNENKFVQSVQSILNSL